MEMCANPFRLSTILLAGCLFVGGCVNLEPREDPTRFYTFQQGMNGPVREGVEWLDVRILQLPAFFTSEALAIREGSRVEVKEFDRWEVLPREHLLPLLEEGLQSEFPGVALREWGSSLPVAGKVLDLRVREFQADAEGTIYLEALLQISSGKDVRSPQRIRLEGIWQPENIDSLIVGYGNLLRELGAEIGRMVVR